MPKTANCPWADDGKPVTIPDAKKVGDTIRCKNCHRILRIKSLAPPVLRPTKK